MDGATGLPGGGRHGSASSGLVWLAVVVLTATGADWLLAVGTWIPGDRWCPADVVPGGGHSGVVPAAAGFPGGGYQGRLHLKRAGGGANFLERALYQVITHKGRGVGTIFFLGGGGGKSVDLPSDCQILGGAQAYPSH